MPEKRVTVWVQQFKDRKNLMLQWVDPLTRRRRSESAETADPEEAERKRADKEYELNHGLHAEPSRMTWETFRELFETEYLSGARWNTRQGYGDTFDLFERLCHPGKLASINERVVSAFVGAMRKEPTRGRDGMMPSSIKVRLQYLRTTLRWAVEQKLLPSCPKFPKIKVPEKTPQPIPAEAFEKMLEKASTPEMRAYLLCGWLAGLRLSEAYLLEWEETDEAAYIDFARNRVVLPAEIVKAVKDQWVPLDPALKSELAGPAAARSQGLPVHQPSHGPAPGVGGRVRSRRGPCEESRRPPDHAQPAEGVRVSVCREGSCPSAAKADAPPEHQDHDGLLRQRGRGGGRGRPGAST